MSLRDYAKLHVKFAREENRRNEKVAKARMRFWRKYTTDDIASADETFNRARDALISMIL